MPACVTAMTVEHAADEAFWGSWQQVSVKTKILSSNLYLRNRQEPLNRIAYFFGHLDWSLMLRKNGAFSSAPRWKRCVILIHFGLVLWVQVAGRWVDSQSSKCTTHIHNNPPDGFPRERFDTPFFASVFPIALHHLASLQDELCSFSYEWLPALGFIFCDNFHWYLLTCQHPGSAQILFWGSFEICYLFHHSEKQRNRAATWILYFSLAAFCRVDRGMFKCKGIQYCFNPFPPHCTPPRWTYWTQFKSTVKWKDEAHRIASKVCSGEQIKHIACSSAKGCYHSPFHLKSIRCEHRNRTNTKTVSQRLVLSFGTLYTSIESGIAAILALSGDNPRWYQRVVSHLSRVVSAKLLDIIGCRAQELIGNWIPLLHTFARSKTQEAFVDLQQLRTQYDYFRFLMASGLVMPNGASNLSLWGSKL